MTLIPPNHSHFQRKKDLPSRRACSAFVNSEVVLFVTADPAAKWSIRRTRFDPQSLLLASLHYAGAICSHCASSPSFLISGTLMMPGALTLIFYAFVIPSFLKSTFSEQVQQTAKVDDFVAVLTCRAGMESRIEAGRASRKVIEFTSLSVFSTFKSQLLRRTVIITCKCRV